jgi:hypothetical protein
MKRLVYLDLIYPESQAGQVEHGKNSPRSPQNSRLRAMGFSGLESTWRSTRKEDASASHSTNFGDTLADWGTGTIRPLAGWVTNNQRHVRLSLSLEIRLVAPASPFDLVKL